MSVQSIISAGLFITTFILYILQAITHNNTYWLLGIISCASLGFSAWL